MLLFILNNLAFTHSIFHNAHSSQKSTKLLCNVYENIPYLWAKLKIFISTFFITPGLSYIHVLNIY